MAHETNNEAAAPRPAPATYAICVAGRLAGRWAAVFEGMQLSSSDGHTTVISGHVPDQAALHGLLQRCRDLGLTLVSVTRLESR
jgi:hypothetical protein